MDVVKLRLSSLLEWTLVLLERASVDKLSVAAMHVLMLSLGHFTVEPAMVRNGEDHADRWGGHADR